MAKRCRLIFEAIACWRRKRAGCRRRRNYFTGRPRPLRRIFEMRAAKGSRFLLAVLVAALACRAARANAAENLLTCIEPDSRSGTSLAVIVDDAPLIHTAQIVSAGHGNAREQTDEVLSKLDSVLKSANANLDRACKLNFYVASEDALLGVRQAISNRFTQA